MAYPLPWGERVRVRGNMFVHPSPSQRLSEPAATLILPHPSGPEALPGWRQGGGKFFRDLDAPQLCCGVLHSFWNMRRVMEIILRKESKG